MSPGDDDTAAATNAALIEYASGSVRGPVEREDAKLATRKRYVPALPTFTIATSGAAPSGPSKCPSDCNVGENASIIGSNVCAPIPSSPAGCVTVTVIVPAAGASTVYQSRSPRRDRSRRVRGRWLST
jgi:hypothetical protein